MLAQIRLQDDVRRHAVDRHEVGDVDEFGKAGDGLVEAGGLQLELGARLAEGRGPGVEFLNAALFEGVRLDEALQGEEFAERIGDRRAGGGNERPAGVLFGVDEAGLDEEVPGALRAVRIDAFQRRLVGRERELSELLHLVDDKLVDPDLGDRQHVVLAAFQGFERLFKPLLHALDALPRDAVVAVDPFEKIGIGVRAASGPAGVRNQRAPQ